MWTYEKRLQFPVRIIQICPKAASLIISQLGGPDGGSAASMRYLPQRYTMPCKEVGRLLADIGTGELAHLETICVVIYQLTKNLTPEQAKTVDSDTYYVDHTTALWPVAAADVPFNAREFQSESDAITGLHKDPTAEQEARTTCGNLIRIIEDPEVREPLKFLRVRKIVHFQCFGETLEKIRSKLDEKNFYYFNPGLDRQPIQDEKQRINYDAVSCTEQYAKRRTA